MFHTIYPVILYFMRFVQMRKWGSFWAINMLFVERLHVLLKRMGAGHKDRMQSFANHYDIWQACQSTWRWEQAWTSPAKRSTMAGYKDTPEHDTVTVALGARGSRKLDRILHMQVLELWATENTVFDKLLDKFKADARRARTGGSRTQASSNIELRDWRPRGQTLSDQAKAWLRTPRTVTVQLFAMCIIRNMRLSV